MLFLIFQTCDLRLIHIDLQSVLGQVFHELLQLILGHVELVLSASEFSLEVLDLSNLDVDLSLETGNLLVVVADLAFHFCLRCFELGDLVCLSAILVIELLIYGL